MDLTTLGKAPISDAAPAGEDVREAPGFESLQGEIDKLTNPALGSTTDWPLVVKASAELLRDKGKDLLVACYLAGGLLETQGPAGLKTGLAVLADLLETHWDDMFPSVKRMRGRRNAIEWWMERIEPALQSYDGPPIPAADIEAMRSDLQRIDEVLKKKDEEPPAVFKLESAIASLPVEQAQTAEEEPAAPAASRALAPSGPAPAPAGPVASAQDAQRAVEAGFQRLGEVAGYLLEQDIADPLPYRLNRMAAWWRIADRPPAQDGRTRIPAPTAQLADIVAGLVQNADHENAIRFAEGRLPQYLFWLDLNRIAAQSLQALGARGAPAAEAVAQETAHLLRRLPGLENLAFADGTPFAGPETLGWLAEIQPAGAPPAPSGGEDASALNAATVEARDMLSQGNSVDAAARIQREIDAAPSGRSRLAARIALCELLVSFRKVKEPWPYLQPIVADIDAHGLEAWEPELALRGLKLVHAALKGMPNAPERPSADQLLQRIAKLDYAEALRLAT